MRRMERAGKSIEIPDSPMRMIAGLIGLFLFAAAQPGAFGQPTARRITVAFRFDDYSSRSQTEFEERLIDTFKAFRVPCTFGVIPYVSKGRASDSLPAGVVPLTQAKADLLKEGMSAGVLEVAQHGYSHQTTRAGEAEADYSEFSGLAHHEQVQRIARGKRLLEERLGVPVTVFMPPWNSYDAHTLQALAELGFTAMSADPRGAAEVSSQLAFLPATSDLAGLRDAIRHARQLPDRRLVIVTLFHAYDFREVNAERGILSYGNFVDLLAWVTSQPDVDVQTLGQAAETIEGLGPQRLRRYAQLQGAVRASVTPPVVANRYAEFLRTYPSGRTLRSLAVKLWFSTAFVYVGALMISIGGAFVVGSLTRRKSRAMGSAAQYGGLVLLVLCAAYALHDLTLYFRSAMVLTALLGGCIGIWLARHRNVVNEVG